MEPETPESIPGYTGSYVVAADLKKNVEQAHAFLFPDSSYEPTDTVTAISDDISYITGIYAAEEGMPSSDDTEGEAEDGDD